MSRWMTIVLIVGLFLTGCQTHYVHPTKPAAEFERDKFDCQEIADQAAYNVGRAGDYLWINSRVHQCLQAKHGWVKQAAK